MQPTPHMSNLDRSARTPRAEIQRSKFDRSHSLGTAFDGGYLVPIFADFAFPGDTFIMRPGVVARFATLLRPIMDRVMLDIHWWAVPVRLLWSNWRKMMGEQDNPGDSISYTVPVLSNSGGVTVGSIHDHLDIPPTAGLPNYAAYGAFYQRAYNQIYNQQYRDQNYIDSVSQHVGDGPDLDSDYTLLKRGKRMDYFTGILPEPQKGNAVTFSLGTTAPITGAGNLTIPASIALISNNAGTNAFFTDGAGVYNDTGTNVKQIDVPSQNIGFATIAAGLTADLSAAQSISINDFRNGAAMQQQLERDMRSGTRLTEMITANFGVTAPDFRMQRPEFLGGGSVPVGVHQVAQTAPGTTSVQGQLSAFGLGADGGSHIGFTQSFVEHCVVLGIASVRTDYRYAQGLPREYSYSSRFDFYLPTFANLGEQAVLARELLFTGVSANDDNVIGYVPRFDEMRWKPNRLHGLMRPQVAGSIGEIWTAAQELSSATIDQDFIEENPPFDRVIATPTEPHFIADFWFDFKAVRAMPMFAVPGLTRI